MIEVAPSESFSSRISRTIDAEARSGSSPAKGSSYRMSCGSSAIERASATRRAMPPESSAGISCGRAAQAHRLRASSCTRSWIRSSGSAVCSRSGKATFSYTDMSVNSAPNWNSMPILRRMRVERRRGRAREVACAEHARRRRASGAARRDDPQQRGLAAARLPHDADDRCRGRSTGSCRAAPGARRHSRTRRSGFPPWDLAAPA